MKQALIVFYFLFQISIGVFSIRLWPITDYPMFGSSFEYFDSVEVIKVLICDDGGKCSSPQKSLYGRFGAYFFRPDQYSYDRGQKTLEALSNILRDRKLNVSKIQLIKKIAKRKGKTHFFSITHEVLNEKVL